MSSASPRRPVTPWAVALLALACTAPAAEPEPGVTGRDAATVPRQAAPPVTASTATLLGAGTHRYAWVPGWLDVPGGGDLGNTHGEIVVDDDGTLYLNTDTDQAIMVFGPDGRHERSFGAEFRNGLHGMYLSHEDAGTFLYIAHFNRHEVAKLTLTGEVLWRLGAPQASGLYESAEQFRPTSVAVAPDGHLYVADGYGLSWIHHYDDEQRYLGSFGGPGSEPGELATPHGIWIDTRTEPPVVLVADRENHRLQTFTLGGEHLDVIDVGLRRPCKIQERDGDLVIPDLEGRVTILDRDNRVVAHLGDNPDPALRAVNGVPREQWRDGEFLAPHSAAWDRDGNLYVMDWNALGRITKLQRLGDS